MSEISEDLIFLSKEVEKTSFETSRFLEELEITKIGNVFNCNNCGAYVIHKLKNLKHYPNCQMGESKKWEEYYSKEETDDGEDIL